MGKNKTRQEKYGNSLDLISEGVEAVSKVENDALLLSESLLNIELVRFPVYFQRGFSNALQSGLDTVAALDKAAGSLEQMYNDYYEPLDREISFAMLEFYLANAREEIYPDLGTDFANMDCAAYVDDLFANSIFTSCDRLKTALAESGLEAVQNDKATALMNAVMTVYAEMIKGVDRDSMAKIAEGSKAFTAGLLEWQKGKATYPDANFTMRLTYGTVKPYSPKDGLLYRHYTTIYGVIEKEDPDNYEFKVPAKLKELYQAKDYGKYAMADGNLPCCFLTNNDITGGNSGSPVLNADGQLIGLAFDGNWESMSSDIMFEPDLQRCICVDIRYVLFLMDKLGGAGYLLKEMDIVR